MKAHSSDEPKYAYVITSNCIGVIIDQGNDPNGNKWYRTDSDGIIEPIDLLFLHCTNDIKWFTRQLNAHIAPSTKELIGI